MLRGPFPGHRRYSITHRAVQRFRELVPTMDELDDEVLRDRLDEALAKAEDGGRAVRTLDAMLGEPQVLIPIEDFGEILYAIIKEDTVVTVLPKGHGEEILQRGQALQQKVASGEIHVPDRGEPPPGDRWDARRRWRREPAGPVVIEQRTPRTGLREVEPSAPTSTAPTPIQAPIAAAPVAIQHAPLVTTPSVEPQVLYAREARPEDAWLVHSPTPTRPDDPLGAAMWDALERGSRRAAVVALHELFERKDLDEDLLPVWNEIASLGIPQGLRLGDLIDACLMTKR